MFRNDTVLSTFNESKIHEQALQYEETLVEIANQKSKKYNKIIHDYKSLLKI